MIGFLLLHSYSQFGIGAIVFIDKIISLWIRAIACAEIWGSRVK